MDFEELDEPDELSESESESESESDSEKYDLYNGLSIVFYKRATLS